MAKKQPDSIFDYIAWLVLAGELLWLILKVIGIINTPVLLEYAPLFGAVYLAGWAMHKLNNATGDISMLKTDFKETEKKISNIDSRIFSIDSEIRLMKKSIRDLD
ncbi:MAG: hypothetical protein V1659_03955 [Candidatus Woesearchaeota archaeon]